MVRSETLASPVSTRLAFLLVLASTLTTGCAHRGHPVTAIGSEPEQAIQDQIRIDMHAVLGAAFVDVHDTDTLIRWRKRVLYRPWPFAGDRDHVAFVPIVPRPSVEVTIHNDGDTPLSFAFANIEVTDDSGGRYRLATKPADFVPSVLDPLLIANPHAWLEHMGWDAFNQWPTTAPTKQSADDLGAIPLAGRVVQEAAQAVPLFGQTVIVAPHGSWDGALVFQAAPGSKKTRDSKQRGSMFVSWSGARVGAVPSSSVKIEFPLVPEEASEASSPCMIVPENPPGNGGPPVLKPVVPVRPSATPQEEVLLRVPAASHLAKDGVVLRAIGNGLIGAGIVAGVSTAAGIGVSHHPDNALAGLSLLAISAVGGVLDYAGWREERKAMRTFNTASAHTGVCSAPR